MTALYRALEGCRICGNTELVSVLDLGSQCMTGWFPRAETPDVPAGPLELVLCQGTSSATCGLLQLKHSYDGPTMYGKNYGYRSSLNGGMVKHLRAKVESLVQRVSPGKGDVVVDIGSNDGTSLSFYPEDGPTLIGIDPTSAQFIKYYRPHIRAVPEFFSAATFRRISGSDTAKAKIVTSIAMFYDLDQPMRFMQDVCDILADDGIWHFEQSYLPTMLAQNSYDTVCHEHFEYYSLRQIVWMAERVGLRIVDVEFNDVNGGSFAVTAQKAVAAKEHAPIVRKILQEELEQGLSNDAPYRQFAERVARHRDELCAELGRLRNEGRRVFGLGASTKGNVILQYCGLGPRELEFVAEVNPDKFGCVTPGTKIPIIAEEEAKRLRPDVFFVLPWHFRPHFVRREEPFLKAGGRLLFPLPQIQLLA